jgi:hypothetical protein
MSRYNVFSILIILFLGACTPSPPEIEGFDPYIWQRDKWGCKQERAAMLPSLMEARQQIYGLREAEVIRLFGKADEQELYQRNQKFLIYYLEPNEKCYNTEDVAANADVLQVRLNAMGIANELFVRKR